MQRILIFRRTLSGKEEEKKYLLPRRLDSHVSSSCRSSCRFSGSLHPRVLVGPHSRCRLSFLFLHCPWTRFCIIIIIIINLPFCKTRQWIPSLSWLNCHVITTSTLPIWVLMSEICAVYYLIFRVKYDKN